MLEVKIVKTPMEVKLTLESQGNEIVDQIPYQRLVGSLMYLAIMIRPAISYRVSFLSQFNNSYNKTHWRYAKRILRYLKGAITNVTEQVTFLNWVIVQYYWQVVNKRCRAFGYRSRIYGDLTCFKGTCFLAKFVGCRVNWCYNLCNVIQR